MSVSQRVKKAVETTLRSLAEAGELGPEGLAALKDAQWTLERPKRPEHGDLATNAPLALAKRLKKNPRALAETLVARLVSTGVVRAAEVAGPGFVNLRLAPSVFHAELADILRSGASYGHAAAASGERIHVEFVSANPTGPLLVAHGRGAVFGDVVARLLEATGHRVTREYYVNDFGNQVRLFAESVLAASQGRNVPDDGYKGAYIDELATWLKTVDPNVLTGERDALARTCVMWMLQGVPGSKELPGIKTTLRSLGVEHDVWFSEESLHRWGQVAAALRQLDSSGFLVRKDGALFFKAKDEASDDKDRVVQKSDGLYTYFASDIAYHADKVSRGYDRLINVLGADHHGYVARVRNALEALGLPSERFEALLYQLVFVYRDGALVKSSKRAGNIITVEEVIEEVDEAAGRRGAGSDALRYFFLSRSANSNVDFDLDLAKKKSLDNPVFYVQYGHARLCSILRKARSLGFELEEELPEDVWAKLAHPDELAIAARLSEFPDVVDEAASKREPHRVVAYVELLAREFQSYFTRLKNDADPILPPASVHIQHGWQKHWQQDKSRARLAWIEAIRRVYAAGLGLLGISAPERMDRPAAHADDDGFEGEVKP
jgi:arginyl-tRNA synthetase